MQKKREHDRKVVGPTALGNGAFCEKTRKDVENPRGGPTKKHKKFEKKILGGGLRKNTENLRNLRARSTKKHKKFTPPYGRTPTKKHRNLKKSWGRSTKKHQKIRKNPGGGLRKNTEILKNHRGGLRKSQHLAEFQANILGKKSWATF